VAIRAVISDFGGVLTTPLLGSFAAFQDETGISAESLGRDSGLVLEGQEGTQEGRRQDAAEVRDHRANRHGQDRSRSPIGRDSAPPRKPDRPAPRRGPGREIESRR